LYDLVRVLISLLTNDRQFGLVLVALKGFPQLTELMETAVPSGSLATLLETASPFRKKPLQREDKGQSFLAWK
jgi:hypothetical protein